MRKYDHIFFDLDNTLWDFDANSKLALKQTLEELSINGQVAFDNFYKYYHDINTSLWESYRKNEISKSELVRIRFERPLQHFNIRNVSPVEMNNLYLRLMPLQTKLIDGAIPTLEYLKSRGYQMHIITNGFREVQNQKLKTCGLNKFFNWVFTSEEIRYPKPDKRIFHHALKCCNAKKSKSIMIGDSWDVDILGATHSGIDQVFFQNNRKNTPPTTIFTTPLSKNISFFTTTPSVNTFLLSKLQLLNEIL